MKNRWHSCLFTSLILLLNLIEIVDCNPKLDDLLAEDVDGPAEFEAFKEGQQINEKAYLHLQRVFLSNLLYVRNLASRMEKMPIVQASSSRRFSKDSKLLDRTSSKYIPGEQQQGRLVSRTLATGVGGGGYSALPPPAGSSQYSALPPSGRQSSKYSAFPSAGADSDPAAGGSNPPRKKRGANAEEDSNSESINEEISFGNEAKKLTEELTKQSQPMVHFKIDYNYKFMDENGINTKNLLEKFLIVKIIKAINIPPMDPDGLSDPFVKLIVIPEETEEEKKMKTIELKEIEKNKAGKRKATSKQIADTLEPIFNEELQIMLPPGKSLLFRIFDGNWTTNEEIGEFIISFETDDEDELLLIDENNNKAKHSLPFEQWRKIEITTEKAQNNMVKSPMIKLLNQSKIMESLIAMDSESRYKAMLDYCNNRWNILNLKTEKSSSPFSDIYIEDVLEIIKKGKLEKNLLEAEPEEIQNYSKFWSSNSESVKDLDMLRSHWIRYEQCVEKIFHDKKEETRTFVHLEMSEIFEKLLKNLMMPQPIYLAKEVHNALENGNLHTLMEFASTLDKEDLAMTRRLVELLYGDNMDFRENTKFMRKLTHSIKNPIRHNKVLNFLYWRYHGIEKNKKEIEESYGETEEKVNALVEMRQNDMLESTPPSVVYSLHKEMDNGTNMVKIKFSLNRMVKLPAMDDNLLSDPYVQIFLLKPEFGKEKKDKEKKEGKSSSWFSSKKSSSKSTSTVGESKLEKKDSKKEQQQPLLGSSSSKGSFSSGRKLSHTESLMDDVYDFGDEEEEWMDSSQQKQQQIYVDEKLTEEEEKKLLSTKDFKPISFSKKKLGQSDLQNDTLNPIYNIHHPFKVEFQISSLHLKFARLLLLIYDRDGPTNRDDKITDVEINLDPNDSNNYGTDLVKDIRPMLFYQITRRPDHKLIDNINILRAKNLPSTDPDGLSDPLVKLIVGVTPYASTHVVENDLNPVFNVQFNLNSIKTLDQKDVRLELLDRDRMFKLKNLKSLKLKSAEYEKIGKVPLSVLLRHATQYYHGEYMDPFTNQPFKTIKINGHDRPFYDSYGHRIFVAFDPQRKPYPFDMAIKRQVAFDNENRQFVIVMDEQTGEPFPFDINERGEGTKRQIIAKRNHQNQLEAFEVQVDENENGEHKLIRAHHDNGMPVPIERMNPVFQDLFVNDDGHVMFASKYTADPNYGTNYQYLVFKDGKQVALSKNLVFEIVENCPVTGHPVHEMVVPIELDEKIRDHQQKLVASNSSDGRRPQLHYRMEYKDGMLTMNLKKGLNLPNKDNTGKSDPYAVLYLLPSMEKIGKTEVFHENLNPNFNWEFKLKIPKERLKTCTLVFDIIDYDLTNRDDKMGIAMIKLGLSSFIEITETRNPHQMYKKTGDGDEIVWVELDKIGLVEWGKLLMQKHFTMIGPLEFRTYWYMVADEQLQRRYFEQLLIKSFRTQTSIGEGVQQTFGLKHSMNTETATANIHRVLVSRYDYDLSEIVTPQAKRFSRWLDKISAETNMGKMLGMTMKALNINRVAVTRAYRMALRKLMSIENRDLVHYDEFLDHYGLFVSKHIDAMKENKFTFIMNVKDHKMEMKMSSPWQKLSGSDYLHKLINDLNQSVINQMDLMFRRDFRLLVNNKFKENNLMEAEKFLSNDRYSNSNNFSTQQEQEKLITAYMHVLTSFVIAHNKALTIVLQCIGKPYKIIKPKEAKASGADKDEDNSKQQQKRMGIMEKTQMNPMQRTLAMQQELEAQLLDVESVEGRELDPDEEERYYQDLEMAQFRNQQDEHEAFGVGNMGNIKNTDLKCPPFSIDVPETAWIEEKIKSRPSYSSYSNNKEYERITWDDKMRNNLAYKIEEIAKNLKEKLFYDILEKQQIILIGSQKYKYNIGRAILRKLGFLNEKSGRDNNKLAKEIAQKLIDDIGAMMEKKHNQLMSDSDENFVFEQVDFTPMQLSLTGDSAESKFERFLQKCFNWLNARIQSLHSKSVKKKNRMARFLFKWIHSFTSSIRDLFTGKEKKLTFLLRTFFPALYYGRKILVKLGKILKKMAGKIRTYLFTANGRREFKKDVYELMHGAREAFKNDNWKLMKKYVDENAAHNLSGTDQKEKEDFKKMSQDFFQNEAKTQNNEEELFDSLGSIGKTMIGGKNNAVEENSASGNQQYDQFDSMPPNSMDRFYTWEMELDDSVAASSQAAEYSSLLLKPRRKREIYLAARNQTIFNGDMDYEIVTPNQFQNSTNIDTNNFRTNSPTSSNYYDQPQQYYQSMMGLRRTKRKGGFGRASAGGFGKSAVASKRAAIYYHSPSPFMSSYDHHHSTYTYVYISDNHYHDGGQCLMTSHKWMLLGVWTVGHGFFFLMVTRPVHKDMKRVNCDEKHGFKEFCKSFFNHLFFKYIKGIFTLGKAVFQRIRGQYKWRKEMNAREYKYTEGTTGSETGKFELPDDVSKPTSFATHLFGEQYSAYREHYFNDCARIYSGLLIAFQLLIWLVGIIVIIAAF